MNENKPHFPPPRTQPSSAGPFREPSAPAVAVSALREARRPLEPSRPTGPAPLPVDLAGDRVVETFGFTGGAFGLAGLLVGVAILVDTSIAYEWWHAPAALAIAVLGLGYEIFRRRHRLAFVPHGADRVGVYRKKKLQTIARVESFARYRLSIVQTTRQFAVFLLPAFAGSLFFWIFASEGHEHVTAMLVAGAGMVGGVTGFFATAWSRVVCIQFVMQTPKMENEIVVLRRSAAAKLNLRA